MLSALPPLNALKAFEAAARHNGFVPAAQELGVSPAAVSQLVQKLEQYLGKTLFVRFNNRITLTDAGKAVFTGVTPALNDIAETVRRVSRTAGRRKLVVSCIASVAECWLAPALARYLVLHPKARIDLRTAEDNQDMPADADLWIGYGRCAAAEVMQEELVRDAVLPLCAPRYLEERRGKIRFTSGLSADLIHTSWGAAYGTNPSWRDWYNAHAPGQRIDLAEGHQVNASRLALQWARDGVGVALGHRWLAAADLTKGKLVSLSDKTLPLGQSYYLAWQPSRSRRDDVMQIKSWLLDEVRIAASGLPPHP